MKNIIAADPNTIKAHLKHLLEHGEFELYQEAKDILIKKGLPVPEIKVTDQVCAGGCPGSTTPTISLSPATSPSLPASLQSRLQQWQVQLQLINSNAGYFESADLLIAVDCVPFAFANFHECFVKSKIVITFCSKLDQTIDQYIQKLASIIANHQINSISIVRMAVPCCGGIEIIIQRATELAGKTMMVKVNVISIHGEIQ